MLFRSELQLHLNRGLFDQYWIWLSGLFTGKLGASLANGQPVWGLAEPRLINSAVLVFVTGVIGTVIGVTLGAIAALRKDSWFDHITSVAALAVTSLPEFIVAIALIILFTGGTIAMRNDPSGATPSLTPTEILAASGAGPGPALPPAADQGPGGG